MINKILEKKIELLPDVNSFGGNKAIELEYYLVESMYSDIEELSGEKVYGIEIIKKVGRVKELESVTNLSCCREKTVRILNKLADNSVTPIGLPFILDDLLGA